MTTDTHISHLRKMFVQEMSINIIEEGLELACDMNFNSNKHQKIITKCHSMLCQK